MKALVILLTVACLAITLALTGCGSLTLTAATPWGKISSSDGATTVALRPIIIPTK